MRKIIEYPDPINPAEQVPHTLDNMFEFYEYDVTIRAWGMWAAIHYFEDKHGVSDLIAEGDK